MAKKPPMGRPSKYKPEFCEMLVEHMAKGFSFESFSALADVHEDTLYEWLKKHPDFSDSKKRAWGKSRYFWEKIGIDHLVDETEFDDKGRPVLRKKLNHTVWIFNMKNRFGWRDAIENNTTLNVNGIVFDDQYEPDDE